jgi:hypothetical protein
MKRTFTTVLGDEWTTDQDHVKSSNTGRLFFMSEPMQKILNAANADPSRNQDPKFVQMQGRMASRLRELENAPLTPDERSILIVDRDDNTWSHPVSLSNPQFDWKERGPKEGTLMVLTENTYVAIQSVVGNAQMNEDGSGSGYFSFNVMYFDDSDDVKEYCIDAVYPELDLAINHAMNAEYANPLPYLSYDSINFMDLPLADSAGFPDAYAELQLCTVMNGNYREQECNIHIMDRFGQCIASSTHSLDTVFDLRDRTRDLKDYIEDNPHDDTNKILHKFRNSKVCEPETIDELRGILDALIQDRFLKFHTADDQFQMMLSYSPVETFRTAEGKRIHTGKGLPALEKLKGLEGLQLTKGKERSYTCIVKHLQGAMTREVSNLVISPEKLFELISDDDACYAFIEKSKAKSIKFAHNLETGDPACEHQLLAVSCQGGPDDLAYSVKSKVDVDALIRQAQREKTSEMTP